MSLPWLCIRKQSSVWTGAGCVIYNLTSNVTATFSTVLYDFGAFYIGQQATNVNTCSGGACMRRITVKLDPSKYYALNFTNTGSQGIWIALDYSLHPSNSSGKPCTAKVTVLCTDLLFQQEEASNMFQ